MPLFARRRHTPVHRTLHVAAIRRGKNRYASPAARMKRRMRLLGGVRGLWASFLLMLSTLLMAVAAFFGMVFRPIKPALRRLGAACGLVYRRTLQPALGWAKRVCAPALGWMGRRLRSLRIWQMLRRAGHRTGLFDRLLPAIVRQRLRIPRFTPVLAALVALAFGTSFVLGIMLHQGQFSRKFVTLQLDNTQLQVGSSQDRIADLLAEYDITLGPQDRTLPGSDSRLTNNATIQVARGRRVYLQADGQVKALTVPAGTTVAQLLEDQGITLQGEDFASMELTAELTGGERVQVTRVKRTVVTYYSPVLYDLEVIDTNTLYLGSWDVQSAGRDGEMAHTIEELTYDGVLVSSQELGSEIVRQPETRVVLRGVAPTPTPKPTPAPTKAPTQKPTKTPQKTTKKTTQPTAKPTQTDSGSVNVSTQTVEVNGKLYPYKTAISCKVTAYSGASKKTATGTWPAVGTIAVQPNKVPYGTRIYVPGYGIGVAADCGPSSYNYMDGYWMDVFMNSRSECSSWGVKHMTVYLLE